jgi:hypothetical protein
MKQSENRVASRAARSVGYAELEVVQRLVTLRGAEYIALFGVECRGAALEALGFSPKISEIRTYVQNVGVNVLDVDLGCVLSPVDVEGLYFSCVCGNTYDPRMGQFWQDLLYHAIGDQYYRELMGSYFGEPAFRSGTFLEDTIPPVVGEEETLELPDAYYSRVAAPDEVPGVHGVKKPKSIGFGEFPPVEVAGVGDGGWPVWLLEHALDTVRRFGLTSLAAAHGYGRTGIGLGVAEVPPDRRGYCYLWLFSQRARARVVLALGAYPLAVDVMAVLVAAHVYGFASRDGVCVTSGSSLHLEIDPGISAEGNLVRIFRHATAGKFERVRVGGRSSDLSDKSYERDLTRMMCDVVRKLRVDKAPPVDDEPDGYSGLVPAAKKVVIGYLANMGLEVSAAIAVDRGDLFYSSSPVLTKSRVVRPDDGYVSVACARAVAVLAPGMSVVAGPITYRAGKYPFLVFFTGACRFASESAIAFVRIHGPLERMWLDTLAVPDPAGIEARFGAHRSCMLLQYAQGAGDVESGAPPPYSVEPSPGAPPLPGEPVFTEVHDALDEDRKCSVWRCEDARGLRELPIRLSSYAMGVSRVLSLSPGTTFEVGPVRIGRGGSVALSSRAYSAPLRVCADSRVSFRVTAIHDEWQYDDGGPSDAEGFPDEY